MSDLQGEDVPPYNPDPDLIEYFEGGQPLAAIKPPIGLPGHAQWDYWRARYERAWAEAVYPFGARITVTKAEWEELRRRCSAGYDGFARALGHDRDPLLTGSLGNFNGVQVFIEDEEPA